MNRTSRGPRRLAALAAAALALATVTACGGGGDDSKSGNVKIRVSATDVDKLPFMAVLQLAINKGWFKQQGLDVSIYSGGGGGNTLRVVTSGDADIAIAGGASVVQASSKPAANLKVVAPWFQVNDFSWLTAKNGATVNGASLGYSTAGSSTELVLKAMQAKAPQDNIKAVSVGAMGDNWTAAKSGKITAGWAMHPFITQKQKTDGARVLVSARDIIGDFPADMVAVNSGFAKKHSAAVTKFLQVADTALRNVAQQPDAAGKELGTLVGVDEATMAAALKQTPDMAKAYSLKVDPTALKNLSDMMRNAGQIKDSVNWTKVLDQQYLPASDRAANLS
jgi:NitT/TauT family transport system substrate-binding protein